MFYFCVLPLRKSLHGFLFQIVHESRLCKCFLVRVSMFIECGRPSLPSGVERKVLQRVYEPGEDAVLSCAPGYLHAGGSRVIVCSNTGEWSTITFKCARESTTQHCCGCRIMSKMDLGYNRCCPVPENSGQTVEMGLHFIVTCEMF